MEEDNNYNFTKLYGSLTLSIENNNFCGNALLGNSVENIENGGTYLPINSRHYFEVKNETIEYYNGAQEIVIAKVKGAQNLNIYSGSDTSILYYTLDNKIKSVNLKTGENNTVYEFGNDEIKVQKMYVINNRYLGIMWNHSAYRYDLYKNSLLIEEEDEYVINIIPTDYDETFEEDKMIIVTSRKIIAKDNMKNAIENLMTFARNYQITNAHVYDNYLYIDFYIEEKAFDPDEYRTYRISLEQLFAIKVSSSFDSKYFEQVNQ